MRIEIEDDDRDNVQLAPIIDVVFLLLIFFLVASTMKRPDYLIDIDLPEAGGAVEAGADYDPLVIVIDREGEVYLEDEALTQAEFKRRLRVLAAADPERRVRIDGDATTDFAHVVRVLDLCQFEGLDDIGVHIRRVER